MVRDIDLAELAVQTPVERLEHSSAWHKNARDVFMEREPSEIFGKYCSKVSASTFFR